MTFLSAGRMPVRAGSLPRPIRENNKMNRRDMSKLGGVSLVLGDLGVLPAPADAQDRAESSLLR